MDYHYATVPGVFPVPDPANNPPLYTSTRLLMEHALFDLRVPTERLDLLDGTRVFRTPSKYVERLPKDQYGYVIRFGETKIYWTDVSPVGFSKDIKSRWRAL